MVKFQATYFDGKTSIKRECTIDADENWVRVSIKDQPGILSFPLADCKLSPPLGKSDRVIEFPGGAKCSTGNLEAVAELTSLQGSGAVFSFIHKLESLWKLALVCLVGLVIFSFFFIRDGIPLLADLASRKIPVTVMSSLSLKTLGQLDAHFMTPTELSAERQRELQNLLESSLLIAGVSNEYQLELRHSKVLGANALALPSGILIMTDDLVNLAENDQELAGILLHEIGHVENRHSIRNIIQSSGLYFLIMALAGDITSLSTMFSTLPTFLIESGYSREFEIEADEYAARLLNKEGIGTKPLEDILERLTKDKLNLPSFISTHPATKDRISFLREQELDFKSIKSD